MKNWAEVTADGPFLMSKRGEIVGAVGYKLGWNRSPSCGPQVEEYVGKRIINHGVGKLPFGLRQEVFDAAWKAASKNIW